MVDGGRGVSWSSAWSLPVSGLLEIKVVLLYFREGDVKGGMKKGGGRKVLRGGKQREFLTNISSRFNP